MGKLFNTNTWRAPLQLIDCWLPLPSDRRLHPTASANAAQTVQRFARAGWLHREAANGPTTKGRPHSTVQAGSAPNARLRVPCQADAHRSQSRDTRLFLSGSMVEVCAELDRLAAMEQASAPRTA